jgi:hypothetical protein
LAPKDKEGNLDIGEFETAIDWFLNNFTNELNSIDFNSIG